MFERCLKGVALRLQPKCNPLNLTLTTTIQTLNYQLVECCFNMVQPSLNIEKYKIVLLVIFDLIRLNLMSFSLSYSTHLHHNTPSNKNKTFYTSFHKGFTQNLRSEERRVGKECIS